jgi:hypothetical protein
MHWAFNRFSDLGSQGAIYAATAYFLAAAAVIVATRGRLGLLRRSDPEIGAGPNRRVNPVADAASAPAIEGRVVKSS